MKDLRDLKDSHTKAERQRPSHSARPFQGGLRGFVRRGFTLRMLVFLVMNDSGQVSLEHLLFAWDPSRQPTLSLSPHESRAVAAEFYPESITTHYGSIEYVPLWFRVVIASGLV